MQAAGFLESLSYIARGWQIVRQPGLRRFVWAPLIINCLVFLGGGVLLFGMASDWLQSVSWLQRHSDWAIVAFVQTLLHWIAGLVILFFAVYLLTLLANLIGAPFNGLLAEKVEAHLTGRAITGDGSLGALLRSVPRTLVSELRKLFYLALWMLPLILLHFVPVINLFAPVLLFLFGAWMLALEYIDHPMGNHGHGFAAVRAALRQRRAGALGFGVPIALLTLVPLVNLVLMPVAVAAATAFYVDHLT